MSDVHLSGPVVGGALRERGHGVLAVDQSPELREPEDPELLRLAKEEGGILVTSNVGDFVEQVTEWAYAGESHASIIMVAYPRSGEDASGSPDPGHRRATRRRIAGAVDGPDTVARATVTAAGEA